MQYILQEEEYARLLKRETVAKAVSELEKELRVVFDSMARSNMYTQVKGIEDTREFKEYTDAFKNLARKL